MEMQGIIGENSVFTIKSVYAIMTKYEKITYAQTGKLQPTLSIRHFKF